MTGRLRLVLIILTVALTVLGLYIAFAIIKPTPPSTIRFATGPAGSAYASFGEQYRQVFADNGIDLQLVESAGSLENFALLADPENGVDAAFVSMGAGRSRALGEIESIGGVFFEPMWFFHRGLDIAGGIPAAMAGKTISIGPSGSATNAAARVLFDLNGIDIANVNVVELTPGDAAARLQAGDIDALFLSSAVRNAVIKELVGSPEITLQTFERADAYVALYPALTKLVVPAGLGSLADNLPPEDVQLVAFTTIIAIRDDLHDAIQTLLLDAASSVHGRPDVFHTAGRFPAPVSFDVPLSPVAERFYESGRPFLQRYLPFWLAVLVMQIFVAAIPVIGVLYPAIRFMPSVFDWAMRRRIHRMYTELRGIELLVSGAKEERQKAELLDDLERLERKARRLRLPNSFAHLTYTLRSHINVVRQRLTN